MIRKKVGTITLAVGLITAGVLLFAQNFIDITISDVTKYWPVLLIGLGLEMIIYMIMHHNEEGNVKIGVDGFCIALIIILAVLSGGTKIFDGDFPFNFRIDANTVIDGVRYKSEVKEVYSRDGIASSYNVNKVFIDNTMGNVKVFASDSNSIKIEADVYVKYNDEQKAREYAKRSVAIEEGNTTRISVVTPQNHEKDDFAKARVNFTVYIPKNASVEIIETFGEVTAEGIDGDVEVENKYGGTEIRNIGGNVNVDSAFGKIVLEDIRGRVFAETKNGKIEADDIKNSVELQTAFGSIEAENIDGDLKAVSKNGKVEAINVNGKTELESYFGSVKLDGINGEVKAESKNGSIDAKDVTGNVYLETAFGSIKLDSNNVENSNIYAETKFGSINTEHSLSVKKSGSAVSAEGTIGSGQYRIQIKTSNGSIDIK